MLGMRSDGDDKEYGMMDGSVVKNCKEQGEWAELCFMARAAGLGMSVAKPHGDSRRYDVLVDAGRRIWRVQVKSTIFKEGVSGYSCTLKDSKGPYKKNTFDFVSAYVIPEDVWYLIPAAVLLRGKKKKAVTLLPEKPRHPERYKCEGYREDWGLLLPGRRV